jgi:hypothetical protein
VYETYCLTDPVFYDAPWNDGSASAFERPAPEGWACTAGGEWIMYHPERASLAAQGWKVHSSTCLSNASDVFAATWDYCIPRRIAFKVLRNEKVLLVRNSKSADRTASGKFVTIYPSDVAQFEATLAELGAILRGQPGPSILSDLRWEDGPLYVRYGGFTEQFCLAPDGTRRLAIKDDSGELVPDERGVTFEVPAWVLLPGFLAPPLAARTSATVDDLPYRIDSALHFSNGGGVYRGIDRESGEPVVLKEARPHAGLGADGADAVARLDRERLALERLAGLDVVPALRGSFTREGHHFLVMDFVEGASLDALIVRRHPLTGNATGTDAESYADWALGLCDRVEQAVDAVHARGTAVGDLHSSNVIVRPDGRVVLVDWEDARLDDATPLRTLGRPGFIAPQGRSAIDSDRYALACLRLYMFLPLTRLFALDDGVAADLAAEIVRLFPVPQPFVQEAVDVIEAGAAGRPARSRPDPSAWPDARDSMIEAILASATPQRDDRLFPGDVQQFAPGGGLNIAHGAAGVLLALHLAGAPRVAEHEDWLVARATSAPVGTPLGFYNGLHGVAYVLEALDRREDALRVVDRCLGATVVEQTLGLDLFGGIAGIALDLAHIANAIGDAALLDMTWKLADEVADRVTRDEVVRAGLMRGASGAALLFLRLHDLTGDVGLLDTAAEALRHDLRHCVRVASGALHVDEGWRTMPYLADGSAGIGMVLRDYLEHRDDEQFADAAAAISLATTAPFYIEPGLFRGRAGMLLSLVSEAQHAAADEQRRLLAWHALEYQGQLAFPGEGLLRLSMDLATGTAGVLLALTSAATNYAVRLPFHGST